MYLLKYFLFSIAKTVVLKIITLVIAIKKFLVHFRMFRLTTSVLCQFLVSGVIGTTKRQQQILVIVDRFNLCNTQTVLHLIAHFYRANTLKIRTEFTWLSITRFHKKILPEYSKKIC